MQLFLKGVEVKIQTNGAKEQGVHNTLAYSVSHVYYSSCNTRNII